MKNVFDIKNEKQLDYVLSRDVPLRNLCDTDLRGKVLVVVHLYYLDTLDFYFPYIENIPGYADVIITVSNSHMKQLISQKSFKGKERCRIFYKENRGRDISALLVACRAEILKYEYICFVHDKKEKSESGKIDTEHWIYSLWENVLASTVYINNIILTLRDNPKLGVVVPPLFVSEKHGDLYRNTWYKNFNLSKQLAERLHLQCDLDETKSPITLGTVFWAKVSALKKLFEVEWKYEDFGEEPLPNDGTISHAIERCFAYVAQDAGYETGWVMTDKFAIERMRCMEELLRQTFYYAEKYLGVQTVEQFSNYEKQGKRLKEFYNKYKTLYIYGAGIYGKRCLLLLEYFRIPVKAFLVTEGKEKKQIHEIPVLSIEEADLLESCGIIVAVSELYKSEITDLLYKKNQSIENVFFFS